MALTLVPGALTAFNFDELDPTVYNGNFNIQRMGVNLVSAANISEAKSQLALQKDPHK